MDKVQDIKTHLQILKSINKTIVPTFNKIVMIKTTLSKYIENNRDPLNKLYNDDLIKSNELKKIDSKSNKLLDAWCKHFFNQKVLNESILENTNTKKNIIKYIKIINNKRPCIGNKEEYQNDINVLI